MAREGTRRHLGDEAEALALKFLQTQQLTLLERNVRVGPYEIDVVAREGAVLVIIEIRARSTSSMTSGLSSVCWSKRRHLRYAAERLWRKRYRYDESLCRIRFDVVSLRMVGDTASLEYVRGAF